MTESYLGEFEQLVLLAVLRLGENAYGVTILDEIRRRTGRQPALGAIYTTLARLERKKLVSYRIGDPLPERGGRRKKLYRLEPRGAEALGRAVEVLTHMIDGLGKKQEAH